VSNSRHASSGVKKDVAPIKEAEIGVDCESSLLFWHLYAAPNTVFTFKAAGLRALHMPLHHHYI
jgi:hypothetical protein